MNPIIIDPLTISISIALLLVGIVAPMLSPFFRFGKKVTVAGEAPEGGPVMGPPLSVVLTPMDDHAALRANLPHLLGQDYPAGYQVIVVLEQGDHDAEAIVEAINRDHCAANPSSHARIYTTYIPDSSRYVSCKKLAITLGVKACQTEWVVLTEPTCRPLSPQWLSRMAAHCTGDTRLVTGYTRYDDDTPAYRRFERMHTAFGLMRQAAGGTAYRDNSHNLMFRKSDFMADGGYLGNLHLVRGEYDFLVNKLATQGITVLEAHEEAWLTEDAPSHKQWLNSHIFYLETRKSLDRSFMHRLRYNTGQTALHLSVLLPLAVAAYAMVAHNWVLAGASALSLVLTFVLRTVFCASALRAFGEQFPAIAAPFFELGLAWHNLWYIIRHRTANKLDFTTHKI